MAGLCPTNCGDETLTSNPQGNCTVSIRQTTPSRVLFFLCDTDLPSPITDENIVPFFTNGSIVASMELANVTFGDPVYEELNISDCQTAYKYVASRSMTFSDFNAVTSAVSSPEETNEYLDYDFWQDKKDKQTRLNYMIAYCNGDVKVARDENGDLLSASVTAVLNYQRPTAGGKSTEFKQVELNFDGDPINLKNKPEFNLVDAGITL